MIPDSLKWSLYRRSKMVRTIRGFSAHYNTYASSDCNFAGYVSLHKDSNIISSNIGRETYITGANIANATTGKFCSIGQGARVGLGKHPIDFLSTHPAIYSSGNQTKLKIRKLPNFNEVGRVVIGNDVWIGADAMVMGGVKLEMVQLLERVPL